MAPSRAHREAGFSLIEVIIVVALMAYVYVVAIPQFSVKSGVEASTKLNQLAGDVRSAFDLAVLSGKTYRMVLNFASGDYWLEEADRPYIYLGNARLDRDLTATEEKEEREHFDFKFREYEELAGQPVIDPKTNKEVLPVSPVVQAKSRLQKPVWKPVENIEWGKRTLGPHFIIQDMQSEHHGHKQDFTALGAEARGIIYFFPSGYVQRAVIHVAYKLDDMTVDTSQAPYTVTTNPYEGTADIETGYIEVNVHEDLEK